MQVPAYSFPPLFPRYPNYENVENLRGEEIKETRKPIHVSGDLLFVSPLSVNFLRKVIISMM